VSCRAAWAAFAILGLARHLTASQKAQDAEEEEQFKRFQEAAKEHEVEKRLPYIE